MTHDTSQHLCMVLCLSFSFPVALQLNDILVKTKWLPKDVYQNLNLSFPNKRRGKHKSRDLMMTLWCLYQTFRSKHSMSVSQHVTGEHGGYVTQAYGLVRMSHLRLRKKKICKRHAEVVRSARFAIRSKMRWSKPSSVPGEGTTWLSRDTLHIKRL